MLQLIKIVGLLFLLSLAGCSSMQIHRINYDQPSPRIKLDKLAGHEGYTRDKTDSRYNPLTTLDKAAMQAADVSISVVFDFRAQTSRRQAVASKCKLYIKPSDSSQYDVIRCTIMFTGTGFMVEYRVNSTKKALALNSLMGRYIGGRRPSVPNGRFIDIRYSSGKMETFNFVFNGDMKL
jgi:hypothetical protein